jgi:hypothetical protein
MIAHIMVVIFWLCVAGIVAGMAFFAICNMADDGRAAWRD